MFVFECCGVNDDGSMRADKMERRKSAAERGKARLVLGCCATIAVLMVAWAAVPAVAELLALSERRFDGCVTTSALRRITSMASRKTCERAAACVKSQSIVSVQENIEKYVHVLKVYAGIYDKSNDPYLNRSTRRKLSRRKRNICLLSKHAS